MLDRTLAPPFNRSTSFNLIVPEKVVLSNGAELYFILGGTQEVCKVELIFPAGRWFEKKWGASYFTSQLLSKGTKNKGSYEIAQLFDRYGAHLEINAGLDIVSLSLYALNKNVERSLNLLLEVLLEPTFPEKELEQLKSIYIQNLKVNQEKISFQASALIRQKIYGNTHPYGKDLEASDVNSLVQQELVDHYGQFFNSVTILVSGNVSAANKEIITTILSPFSKNQLDSPKQKDTWIKNSERQIVEKEGSIQSSIRIGKKSVSRADADYPEVLFVNHILGGYFGSRLMKNIREDKGLTYSVSSGLHTMTNGSHLVIGADVNRENLVLAFDEIRKEVRRLRVEKIDAEELETARNHFIGSLQLEITTSFAHADKIKNILIFNLTSDFYQNLITRIDNIAASDLPRIAETYFDEESFIEVAVG